MMFPTRAFGSKNTGTIITMNEYVRSEEMNFHQVHLITGWKPLYGGRGKQYPIPQAEETQTYDFPRGGGIDIQVPTEN